MKLSYHISHEKTKTLVFTMTLEWVNLINDVLYWNFSRVSLFWRNWAIFSLSTKFLPLHLYCQCININAWRLLNFIAFPTAKCDHMKFAQQLCCVSKDNGTNQYDYLWIKVVNVASIIINTSCMLQCEIIIIAKLILYKQSNGMHFFNIHTYKC